MRPFWTSLASTGGCDCAKCHLQSRWPTARDQLLRDPPSTFVKIIGGRSCENLNNSSVQECDTKKAHSRSYTCCMYKAVYSNGCTSLQKATGRLDSTHVAKVRFANCHSIYTGHLRTPCLQGQSTFQYTHSTSAALSASSCQAHQNKCDDELKAKCHALCHPCIVASTRSDTCKALTRSSKHEHSNICSLWTRQSLHASCSLLQCRSHQCSDCDSSMKEAALAPGFM